MASSTIPKQVTQENPTQTAPMVIWASGSDYIGVMLPNNRVTGGTVTKIAPVGSSGYDVSISLTISSTKLYAYFYVPTELSNYNAIKQDMQSHSTLVLVNWTY